MVPRMARIRKAPTHFAALLLLTATAACSGGGSDDVRKPEPAGGTAGSSAGGPAVHVDRQEALADRDLAVRIDGLDPRAKVTVSAQAVDQQGQPWRSEGRFTADGRGRIDLGEQAPHGEKPYEKADATGLLSTMLPVGGKGVRKVGSGDAFSYHPKAPAQQRGYRVRLAVDEAGGRERRLASRTLVREWLPEGAHHRKLTVARDRVDGELYTPARPKGAERKAPVLVFGGSEGGNSGEYAAALLAAHGHPALSLCYFDCGKGSERPRGIDMIDTGYFLRAAKLLREEPGADPEKLAVMGNSRGSEIAQLLGQRHPSVVRDVIAYAPSAVVNGPYRAGPSGVAAWAEKGRPIPAGPIRLDDVRGTVLAVAGGNDKMWGSAKAARVIASQRNASGTRHTQVTYPKAGHHVNWFPFGQPGQEGGADGAITPTAAADQEAREESWPKVLKLLER